ncbi:MAG: NAD(P)/FAD-dependent oxidoreductase [Oscillatoriales cyanobacterium]|nr:MAG: NAD(P)/FAD-dependent oxidoreductase [Oscillatoriales cyanobacterium]
MAPTDTEIIIIGSGIGGLSCGAMLASYGFEVIVCESHSIAGGAAHGFKRDGFTFDSGPSLYSGLSYSPSANPLRQVLDAIGEKLPCITYDTWGCCLPEGDFDTSVGASQFGEVLLKLRGSEAAAEWQKLQRVMEPYAKAATALPSMALRFDLGAVFTLGQFAPAFLQSAGDAIALAGPFSRIMDANVKDPFVSTIAAEVAFMFADWYRPNAVLDYPIGGSGALVDALVRGLERHGGQLLLNSHVAEVLVENNRAAGVRLRSGKIIRSHKAVVSNASVWDTLKLLPENSIPKRFRQQRQATPECDSFMHLHLGIDAAEVRSDLACHYIFVKDWDLGVSAPQNVVLVSIPSLLDPHLAPDGKHVIHAYTPGNEPYDLWQKLDRASEEYKQQKQARAEVMWEALERIIPDIRSRCEVTLVGTPLTHERFLRRNRGSYGPGIRAGTGLFPGPGTPLAGLFCCGDSTFPGIGLPAVAASGAIAANTIAPLHKHLEMLRDLGLKS